MTSRYGSSIAHRKYPRTPHLPWSPGATSDDVHLSSAQQFEGREVVITEKMDGENTSIYADGTHARSLDSRGHSSRAYVKQLAASLAGDIPENFRLNGENIYAVHSIRYLALPDWFLLFGIYRDDGVYIAWDEVVEWTGLLNLKLVPVLYRGIWNEEAVKACYTGISQCGGEQEGYVVRLAEAFTDFSKSVSKFVRRGHVQTDEHWMSKAVQVNGKI